MTDKILQSAVANLLTFENQDLFFLQERSGFEAQICFYCLLQQNILSEPMKIQILLSIILKNHFLNLPHPVFSRLSLQDLEMIAFWEIECFQTGHFKAVNLFQLMAPQWMLFKGILCHCEVKGQRKWSLTVHHSKGSMNGHFSSELLNPSREWASDWIRLFSLNSSLFE